MDTEVKARPCKVTQKKPTKALGLKRLKRLAKFLREVVPEASFNYASYLQYGTKPPLEAIEAGGGCGTTACAMGWTPAVFPGMMKFRPFEKKSKYGDEPTGYNDVVLRRQKPGINGDGIKTMVGDLEAAPYLFGISRHDAHELFIPDARCHWSESGLSPGTGASRIEVADHIDQYVKWVRAGRPDEGTPKFKQLVA